MEYTVLESLCVVDGEGMTRNLKTNLERCLPKCTPLPERENNRLAIVGSGPSVRGYLDEIRNFDGEVWAINGAYDYLQSQGIVPKGFIGCDPLPGLADYLKHPHKDTTFYLAGTCDPSTIEAVKGHDVRLWFLELSIVKYPPNTGIYIVTGGTTVMLRAPFLGWMLGFRDVTFFGADSSFDTDGRYCYKDGTFIEDSKQPINWVKTCDGKGPFPTEICLMKQVSQFGAIVQIWRGKMAFRCGGLLDAFLKSPIQDDSMFDKDAAA